MITRDTKYCLRSYPSYKPSRVPWLGEVPVHWKVWPTRAVFTEINERGYPDEQLLSVTISEGVIRQQALLQDSSQKDSSQLDKSDYKLVRPGDIVYNKMRAWQGATGVSRYRGIVSPAYIVQRPRTGANPLYFHRLLRTPAFTTEAARWSYGIASDMWSLRPEHFKVIRTCVPPQPEQVAIVRYLDYMDRRIRRYVSAKRKLIAAAGGGAAGRHQPSRHSRPRPQCPTQVLWRGVAGRRAGSLGGAASGTLLQSGQRLYAFTWQYRILVQWDTSLAE